MNADGSHPTLLTNDVRGHSSHPAVSTDGRFVFFSSWRTGASGLARMDVNGGPIRIITAPGGDTAPRCSPDGKWVMYQDDRAPRQPVWMVSPDGGTKRPWPGKVTFSPVISPDGRRVAGFYRDTVSCRTVLTVTPFAGGEPERTFYLPLNAIPNADFMIPDLRWTPDGRAVAYVVGTLRAQNIWTQSIDGAEPRPFTDFKDEQAVWSFDWSEDGRLAVARGSVNADVLLITREQKK